MVHIVEVVVIVVVDATTVGFCLSEVFPSMPFYTWGEKYQVYRISSSSCQDSLTKRGNYGVVFLGLTVGLL
jgi:hypothetical protein